MRWLPRAFGGGARKRRDAESALRETVLSLLDRDLDRAEALLAAEAQRSSRGVGVFLALGRLYRLRGEMGRAVRVHQNLLLRKDLAPSDRVRALADLAEDFRRGGLLRRAIAAYEEVLAHAPRHAGALRALVRLHADVRDFDAALAVASRLERQDPASRARVGVWVEQAEVAHAEGRTADARRALKRALRGDPRHARAWVLLGELEAELGHPKAALDAWRRVPELDRRAGPLVYPRLAATFAALDRPRDHEAFLHELLASQPDDGPSRIALARALAARGDTDGALAELRGLLERDPDDLEAHHALGSLLLAAGKDSEALRAFADLLQRVERLGLLSRESSA